MNSCNSNNQTCIRKRVAGLIIKHQLSLPCLINKCLIRLMLHWHGAIGIVGSSQRRQVEILKPHSTKHILDVFQKGFNEANTNKKFQTQLKLSQTVFVFTKSKLMTMVQSRPPRLQTQISIIEMMMMTMMIMALFGSNSTFFSFLCFSLCLTFCSNRFCLVSLYFIN